MGKKKKKNSNYHYHEQQIAQTGKERKMKKNRSGRKFQPRDLLCILAALLFLGSWVYTQQGYELAMETTAVIYAAIILLLLIYFFINPKFIATWKKWTLHVRLYLVILVLADILALVTYDITSNLLYLAIFIVINVVYYFLFLHNRTKEADLREQKRLEELEQEKVERKQSAARAREERLAAKSAKKKEKQKTAAPTASEETQKTETAVLSDEKTEKQPDGEKTETSSDKE